MHRINAHGGSLATLGLLATLAGCDSQTEPFDSEDQAAAVVVHDNRPRYNQVAMRNSHNSYERDERFTEQLNFNRIRVFELDIHRGDEAAHWSVYHDLPGGRVIRQCRSLGFSYCLQKFQEFHLANPSHEVITMLVEDKDGLAAGHTAQDLDAYVSRTIPRGSIYTPGDMVNACNGNTLNSGPATHLNLQAIVSPRPGHVSCPVVDRTSAWPTLGELRGKFIFVYMSIQEINVLNYINSVPNGDPNRLFFTMVPAGTLTTYPTRRDAYKWNIFWGVQPGTWSICTNPDGENYLCDLPLVQDRVWVDGFVTRADVIEFDSDWVRQFQHHLNLFGTDKLNPLVDRWSSTATSTGYPFTSHCVRPEDASQDPATGNLVCGGQSYVNSTVGQVEAVGSVSDQGFEGSAGGYAIRQPWTAAVAPGASVWNTAYPNGGAYRGAAALGIQQLSTPAASWSLAQQDVAVEQSTKYRLLARVRSAADTPNGALGVLGLERVHVPRGRASWIPLDYRFDSGTSTRMTVFGGLLGQPNMTQSGAFFDEIQLQPLLRGDEYVSDGGFESQTTQTANGSYAFPLSPWHSENGVAVSIFHSASYPAHLGQYQAIIQGPSGYHALSQQVPVWPQKRYTARAWVKTTANVTGGRALFAVYNADYTSTIAATFFDNTPQWTLKTFDFDSGFNESAWIIAGLTTVDGANEWLMVDDLSITMK